MFLDASHNVDGGNLTLHSGHAFGYGVGGSLNFFSGEDVSGKSAEVNISPGSDSYVSGDVNIFSGASKRGTPGSISISLL